MNTPREPGYYWAKLKTPSSGSTYNEGIRYDFVSEKEWASLDWEIVQVSQNGHDPEDEEYFSVRVFGVPVAQWVGDFFWGPKIELEPPK